MTHPLSTINGLNTSFQKVTNLGTVTPLDVNTCIITEEWKHTHFEELKFCSYEDFYTSADQLKVSQAIFLLQIYLMQVKKVCV